jgi:alcohol dehydrogenase class IV
MPAKIISGEGSLVEGSSALRALGKRCLIITGAHAAEASGALGDAMTVLQQAGVDATVFNGISENPLLSQCQAAAFTAEAWHADFLLGIGGGSVMDATKAAAWLTPNSISEGDKLFTLEFQQPALPFALVGTTAGTGSEVSATAVITVDAENRKRSVNHPCLYARCVFADPRYTHTMSRNTTISTALDALSHTVEGWFCAACGDVITSFGEKALSLVSDGLKRLAHEDAEPDAALREQLYYGSLWAGMVLNATGTAFPHLLGYALTEDYHLPHGMACAVFLPAFTRRAESVAPERARRLFDLCGGRDAYYTLLDTLVHADIHMSEDQIHHYAPRWEGAKNLARTPGGYTPQDGVALFKKLFLR